MPELLNVPCAQGRLIVTDSHVIVERGNLRSATIPRSALSDVDVKMTLWFFGWTRYNLVFRSMGAERVRATNLSRKNAQAAKRLLTGR